PLRPGPLLGHEDEGRSAVVDAGGVAGGDAAVGGEGRAEPGQLLRARVPPGGLVGVEQPHAAPAVGHRDGGRLQGHPAAVDGGNGAHVAAVGPGVLFLAAYAELPGHAFAVVAHVDVVERTPQAVIDGRVQHLTVAEAVPKAGARQEVGPAAHVFHAACHHDVRLAGAN